MTREAGAGDLLIKYTTVPGNLIARSVEYTPMGMFKILSIANNAKMSGKVKQSEIAMTIGRSIVGNNVLYRVRCIAETSWFAYFRGQRQGVRTPQH